ncbi:MAG: hypothetical protein GY820_40255 [Gammaproteobacteria bacterium]|nr:hypothetical protein [Gammaproteobacteria bacterium]
MRYPETKRNRYPWSYLPAEKLIKDHFIKGSGWSRFMDPTLQECKFLCLKPWLELGFSPTLRKDLVASGKDLMTLRKDLMTAGKDCTWDSLRNT